MLHSANELKGTAVSGIDGEVGTISDIYFDDAQWTIRYLVVDLGGWINSRQVLIPPHAMRNADWAQDVIELDLTRQQIHDSPDIDMDKPVSRQHETDLFNHYGYPYYWTGPHLWGATGLPGLMQPEETTDQEEQEHLAWMNARRSEGDPHLRSFKEVGGYAIHASDGRIGHVDDFLFDDRNWSIQLIAVDTYNWIPGKSVLISPERIQEVSWSKQEVAVSLSREEVEQSPEFDPANTPPFGPKYDLYRRFGMPHM